MRIPFIHRAAQPRAFILSIPKAGTYFLSEILKHAGIEQTYLHFTTNQYSNYSQSSGLKEMRSEPDQFTVKAPFKKGIKKIKGGQFAVGHIPHSLREHLRDFKKFFIKRNLKDAIVSYMNFREFSNRLDEKDTPWVEEKEPGPRLQIYLNIRGEELFKGYRRLVDWEDEPDVFKIKFEELKSKQTGPRIVAELARFLEINPAQSCDEIWEISVSAETLTKSPTTYSKQQYWSERALQQFADFGGTELNHRLGYNS